MNKGKDTEPLVVSIRCCTYNHEAYIRQCLNGFVMQKTNFRFEAIVHDDASTDGTTDIIREYAKKYPNIIKPIYEAENQYSKRDGSLRRIMDAACTGKYIAYCEGDDYWIDPLKLQKQVDYMEQHPNCTLCGTNGLILWDNGFRSPKYFRNTFSTIELKPKDIIGHWCFPTASLLFRKEVLDAVPLWTKKIYSGDQTKILVALSLGTVVALGDLTCVYRKDIRNVSSVSTVADKNRIYVLNQHKLLYSEFDKWTEGRFHAECQRSLDSIEKEIRYIKLKRKFPLFPILFMPQYVLQKIKTKVKNLRTLISKRP